MYKILICDFHSSFSPLRLLYWRLELYNESLDTPLIPKNPPQISPCPPFVHPLFYGAPSL